MLLRAHIDRQAVSAFVDGLNALLRLKARPKRRNAFGNTVGGDMNVAPNRFTKLDRRDNLTAMGEEETERGQLLRLEVNHILAAQKRPIGFQAETGKSDFRLTIP